MIYLSKAVGLRPFVKIMNWLPSRGRGKEKLSTIVLHSTAGASAVSSYNWLKKIGLSYHYIIERDGTVLKCAPLGKVAYHAGISEGPDGRDVNRYSIGICLANKNDGEPYPEAQVLALYWLIKVLEKGYPNLKWLTTHYGIAPKRKTDPQCFDFIGLSTAEIISYEGDTRGAHAIKLVPYECYNVGTPGSHIAYDEKDWQRRCARVGKK